MLRILVALAALGIGFASPALSQVLNPVTPLDTGQPVSASNPLHVSGTFSASLSGFTPGLTFATLTATASSASVALPAGTVVFFQNNGTATVSCTLGVGSATALANEILIPASSGVPLVVGSNTFGACIDQTGSASNLVVLAGGSGLGTPFGGGSGSGGGTVTQGNAGTNAQAWWAQIGDTARGPAKVQAGNGSAAADVALTVTDPNVLAAINAATPAGTNVIGFTSNDLCAQGTKLGASINLTASGQLITGTAAKKTYICSIDLVTATAQNIALVEGTGSTCATNVFGLAGGTTAATGWNFSANGGLSKGAGAGSVYSPSADTNATAANVCLLLSGSGQVSGQITYVQG